MNEPSNALPLFPGLTSDATSSPQDGRAKETRWLVSVLEWLTREADSGGKSSASFESSVPVGFWEKTSPAFCRSMEDGTLEPCSGTWRSWGMGSPTAFLTLNGSAWPNDASVCSLSGVLEVGEVPQKFFLSPKACRGILRRAEKRGRALPPALHEALTQAAGADTQDEDKRTT